jgi:hypothetical protein
MWTALRIVGDRQRTLKRLTADYRASGRSAMADAMGARADELDQQGQILRDALADLVRAGPDDEAFELPVQALS